MRALAVSVGVDGELPSEFRLFVPGWNDTENGRYLFDDVAAADVMAAYEKWGVDIAIDLEHQMLDTVPSADPTARDARGWCKLELRNGELWAACVTWTADGAARLAEKRQRYVSPAFGVDPKTSRVTKILNVAITAIPATHETPALVAASTRSTMDPKLIQEALDALISGDADKSMEILKGLIASAAGAESAEEAAPMSEEMMSADAPPASDEEEMAAVAASARLMRVTGTKTLADALSAVETYRASHVALEAESKRNADERATIELSKRKENAIEFTKLGAETPHTTGLASGKLCARLLNEPLDEQNARLSALRSASRPRSDERPPAGAVAGLSERELAKCKAKGIDPIKYLSVKNSMNGKA